MTLRPRVQVQITHRFEASAERVFDAWLNPATVGQWLFATASGQMVQVELDPRVGGSFLIVERRGDEDVAHAGEYLEIDRPRRLVFTLRVEQYSQEIDQVVVEIVPLETGCELTLTHGMSPDWAEHQGRVEAGWGMVLDALAKTLE